MKFKFDKASNDNAPIEIEIENLKAFCNWFNHQEYPVVMYHRKDCVLLRLYDDYLE